MIVKARIKVFVAVLSIILYSVSSEIIIPTISVDSTPDELHVSWTSVEEGSVAPCFPVYEFSRKVNGVHVFDYVFNITSITLPSGPCEENVFVVNIRCRTGAIVAGQANKTYVTTMKESTQISDLRLTKENNGLTASWSSAEASLECGVTYHLSLTIGDRPHIIYNTTSNTHFFEVPQVPCALVALTVTPFDAGGFGQPYTVSFIAGPGDAGRIQNIEVNNSRIEWRASGDNGYCTVTYGIIIWDSTGNEHVFESNEQYLEFNFVPCGIYNIIIDSKLGDTLVTTLRTNYRRRVTVSDIGKVEGIEFIERDGAMLLTWSPAVIGFCDAMYTARHYINGIQVGSAITTYTSHNFTTNYCAEHSIMIQAIADMIVGEKTTASTTASSREPAAVANLQITKFSDSLFVTWDPIAVGFCPIQYIVEHTISNKPGDSIIVTENSAFLDRIPCSINEITVTAVADTSKGLPISQFTNVSLESLEDVKNIAVEKGEGALYVSWSPIVKGLCEVYYVITNFNGETTSSYETDLTFYTIGKTNCANNTVTVVGVEHTTSITSAPSYYVIDVDIDLSNVQNLRVNRSIDDHLQIDWERPVGSENCVLDYLVNIRVAGNNGFNERTDATSLSTVLAIDGCKIFDVVVTPISPAGRKGEQKAVENTAYLFEVPSVNRLLKHQGVVTWDRPYDVGICDLLYRVEVQNENGLIVNEIETRETEINLDMVPCRDYISSVKAVDVLTNFVSEIDAVEGTGKPRFIEDVRKLNYELNREILSVSWSPAQAGDCAVSYNTKHTLDGRTSPEVVNQPELVVQTISCSKNELEITPFLREGVTGTTFVYSIDVGLDVLEEVTDLAVASNRLEWIRPAFAGNCALTYLVEIIDGIDVVQSFNTKNVFAEVDFIPCRAYRVRVTPQHNGRDGTPTELRFIADALAHAPPAHVKTVPSLSSANVTLEVNPVTVNNCPVEAIRIVCEQLTGSKIIVDRTIQVQDHPARIFQLGLTDLPHNTHFSCKAQVFLPQESEFGQAFAFLTIDILPISLEVSEVTSTTITVSWEEQQGLGRYILYHTLAVTTVGPNHFVQDSCNVPRNTTEYVQVLAGVLSHTITDALPNFKYHISMETRFNIGVNGYADLATVNTLPSVPGPIIDLNTKFILENCAQWSGKGSFIWTPPCDINGDLDRFEVIVGTNYTIGSENREYTESRILRSSDADGYVFSAPIPTLNPFFIYNVSIKIFAAFPGQDANTLKEVPAPAAYTACIADHLSN